MILVSQHVFPAAHYGPLEKEKRKRGILSIFDCLAIGIIMCGLI
jgi:hypothetical protein